jgi:hypothetical protein
MMSNARRSRSAPGLAALAAALMLAGCASTFDLLPEKMGGLPADAPARPTDGRPYPNVYAPDPQRDVQKLSDDEQKTAELELLALRESQSQRLNPTPLEPERRKKPLAKKTGAKQAEKKTPPAKAAARKPAEKQAN